MKQSTFCSMAFLVFVCMSRPAAAQVKRYKAFELPPDTSKATKIFLESFAKKYTAAAPYLVPQKIGGNELFNFYRLPLDNMICLVPNNKEKGHIQVYRQAPDNTWEGAIDTGDLLFLKRYRSMDKFALISP